MLPYLCINKKCVTVTSFLYTIKTRFKLSFRAHDSKSTQLVFIGLLKPANFPFSNLMSMRCSKKYYKKFILRANPLLFKF